MALTDALNVTDSAGYHDPAFRRVLEEHLHLIRNLSANSIAAVTPMQALRYKGDFYGLLNEFDVPDYLKWVTLRVNGFISPADSHEQVAALILVDQQYIRRLYNTHRTQMKVKIKR